MPVTLSILFTSPNDVWDLLSTEGVDLREDDHNLASGQIIATTTDTPIGSMTMTVAPLPVALLAGSQLTFDGAGMPTPITVQIGATANVGATSLTIVQVINVNGVFQTQITNTDIPSGAQARDSGVNAATGARLLTGCRKGTSKVKLYCNSRYDDSELKKAGSVLDWATICAAKFLCTRRAQGCPKSIMADYEEVIEDLKAVQAKQLDIEDIGTRGVDWPAMSNVTVDPGYDYARVRVEPCISEQTPTAYGQFIDWNSSAFLEW